VFRSSNKDLREAEDEENFNKVFMGNGQAGKSKAGDVLDIEEEV
jgi:hypothetical protein